MNWLFKFSPWNPFVSSVLRKGSWSQWRALQFGFQSHCTLCSCRKLASCLWWIPQRFSRRWSLVFFWQYRNPWALWWFRNSRQFRTWLGPLARGRSTRLWISSRLWGLWKRISPTHPGLWFLQYLIGRYYQGFWTSLPVKDSLGEGPRNLAESFLLSFQGHQLCKV